MANQLKQFLLWWLIYLETVQKLATKNKKHYLLLTPAIIMFCLVAYIHVFTIPEQSFSKIQDPYLSRLLTFVIFYAFGGYIYIRTKFELIRLNWLDEDEETNKIKSLTFYFGILSLGSYTGFVLAQVVEMIVFLVKNMLPSS